MERHDSPNEARPTGRDGSAGAAECAGEGVDAWRDLEIWKVLAGADVELDRELLDASCVEPDEGSDGE
jgi:hypothetical protein